MKATRWMQGALGCAVLCMMAQAQAVEAIAPAPTPCPDSPGFRELASFRNVYLGDTHGTQEIPALLQCLVQAAIREQHKPLVVSLELPDGDLPSGKKYWATVRDGKTSQAMWQVYQWLRQQEATGRLRIHYQYDNVPWTGQAAYERHVGEAIKALIDQGNAVITFGGNFHSRKAAIQGMADFLPTGAVIGDAITRVDVVAQEGGEAWNCIQAASGESECKPHRVFVGRTSAAQAGELVDGSSRGHDKVFVVQRFTAALPQFP